jgi:hypothetical protein
MHRQPSSDMAPVAWVEVITLIVQLRHASMLRLQL